VYAIYYVVTYFLIIFVFQAPDGWFVKAAGVKLDKTTLRTVLQGTFLDKTQGTFLDKTQGTFLEKTPPPAPSAQPLESSKVVAKKIEVPCIDQYFDIPMFDFDDDSIDDDDSSSEEESVHDQQQHEQQQHEHNEQQQHEHNEQQQQQQQQQQHNNQGGDNNNKRDNSQLKNEKIPQKLNVVKNVIDSAPPTSTSTVNRAAVKTRSELELLQDSSTPSIYLISQSIGFSVKNKFVTEEMLKKLLNLQAEKKKII
jgi:hypothetical protein